MGLDERRAIKEFKDKNFSAFEESLAKAAGFAVPVTVDWDSLAEEGTAQLYQESIPKVFFMPVLGALKEVARDSVGKSALKAGLKRVELCNVSGQYGESAVSFVDGILKIDHQTTTNADDVELRKDAIVAVLNKAL